MLMPLRRMILISEMKLTTILWNWSVSSESTSSKMYTDIILQTFRNPKPEFLKALEDAGLGVENGAKKGADKKRSRKSEKIVSENISR